MKKYYKFLDYIISFDFPVTIALHTLKQHIPGISETFPQKESICIEFIESNHSQLIYNFESLKINDIWTDSWSVDIPHLLYSYLKYVFFHKDIYFVHSCLIDGNLLIGSSGAGKTTLCIHAIKESLTVSSLDRTCVIFKDNQLVSLAGTDILSVRQEEVQPSLILQNSSHERNLYQYDIASDESIYSVSLFQLSNTLKRKQLEGFSIVHQLFPFFLDSVKNDCFVQNGKLLFCPLYSELKKKVLFHNLENLTIPVYFISGNIQDILFF